MQHRLGVVGVLLGMLWGLGNPFIVRFRIAARGSCDFAWNYGILGGLILGWNP